MPKSITYTPSKLEKILGKNYKWWYVVLFKAKSRTASLFDSAIFTIGQLLILLGTLLTWWLANNRIIDDSLVSKWTYFIVGELLFCFVYTFAEYLGFDFTRGKYVNDMLKPQSFMLNKLFDAYGESAMQNIIKGTFLFFIYIYFLSLGFTDFKPENIFLSLLTLPISFLILYFLGFTVACSGFFLPRIHGISMNYTYLLSLFMGRAFPLNLLIPDFKINLLNPFAYTFYHPMQIYLGKYDTNQTILVFLGGIFWCLVLYLLARFVFKAGLKRNEAVGL